MEWENDDQIINTDTTFYLSTFLSSRHTNDAWINAKIASLWLYRPDFMVIFLRLSSGINDQLLSHQFQYSTLLANNIWQFKLNSEITNFWTFSKKTQQLFVRTINSLILEIKWPIRIIELRSKFSYTVFNTVTVSIIFIFLHKCVILRHKNLFLFRYSTGEKNFSSAAF